MAADSRTSVVVLTHNRAQELERCLDHLLQLPEQPRLIVVDNASQGAETERFESRFPGVELVRCDRNLGAAGRNAGVARVSTQYVAFCDDDTWWEAGALAHAADQLDAHPRIGAISARVLVGPENRLDATCERMAASPLDAAGLPGPALIGFMAGAVVMRTDAFRQTGGYEPRFFLGAEEALMGLELAARNWAMVYVSDVITHHHPSAARDPAARRLLLMRNRLWIAWLRLPLATAWHETRHVLHDAAAPGIGGRALRAALRDLPWVLAQRRAVPAHARDMWLLVHASPGHRPSSPPRPVNARR